LHLSSLDRRLLIAGIELPAAAARLGVKLGSDSFVRKIGFEY